MSEENPAVVKHVIWSVYWNEHLNLVHHGHFITMLLDFLPDLANLLKGFEEGTDSGTMPVPFLRKFSDGNSELTWSHADHLTGVDIVSLLCRYSVQKIYIGFKLCVSAASFGAEHVKQRTVELTCIDNFVIDFKFHF